MEMTFEDGMQESMLPIFDMETDDSGNVIWMDSGEPVPTFNGHEPLHVDKIGGFIKHPRTGEDMLLRDNFCDICDYTRADEEAPELLSFLR